ncbi:MAG TPA: PaaI family thioesterase [Beijerinckiaceae bacterium]|nr:PaaI family thioesterase [Beijerinckiaceae bacterium]
MPSHKPALSREEMIAFLEAVFPEVMGQGANMQVEDVGYGTCRIRLKYKSRQLRPGGTISGPTMMALADFSVYVAVLSALGKVALAVTTNLNINFLKKPSPGDLIADCRLFKIGKRLCVGEAMIHGEADDDLVAHAVATYSVPPEREGGDRGLSPPV